MLFIINLATKRTKWASSMDQKARVSFDPLKKESDLHGCGSWIYSEKIL